MAKRRKVLGQRGRTVRLPLNMFGMPAALSVSAYLSIRSGYQLEAVPHFMQYGELLVYAGKAAAAIALVWSITSMWKVWRAYQGKGKLCHLCGYPGRDIASGRKEPHFSCWNCGAVRTDRV